MGNIIIQIVIGLIAIVGFFIYWSKSSNVFQEGGVINEWWKNRKQNKISKKEDKKK